MTQWLPIETYPYDGTWGLFRGGVNCSDDWPAFVGKGFRDRRFNDWDENVHEILVYAVRQEGGFASYADPTEWMPLDLVVSLIDESAVTAARIMM